MKRYVFLIMASAVLLAVGCTKMNIAGDQELVPDGEMLVRLGFDGPRSTPGVRSYVNGNEPDIESMVMLCFDNEGKFIVKRNATLAPVDGTKGRLSGTVPANTCRIHFVANLDPTLSGVGMGSPERMVMKLDALSSGITDDVRFWGYHSETSASAMKSWLAGGNTVKMLRDRAKVILKKDASATDISSIQWTIANGLNKGYLAPVTGSGNTPYTNNYESLSRPTEYTGSDRYASMTDSEAIWAGLDEPQFLFENANTLSNPVKVIIKTTYTDNTVRYHTVLLQSNQGVPYPVVRNQTFTLTVKKLPVMAGSGSFLEALTTKEYSNNPYAQVSREVEEVSNGTFTLKVAKNVYLFDQDGNGVVKFYYTGEGISELTKDDFNVSWEAKSDDEMDEAVALSSEGDGSLATPEVAFNSSTGEGTVTFPLAELSEELKHSSMQIIATNSGLSRFVDIYSITGFSFAQDPDLVDNYSTRDSGGKTREVYRLTFSLPSDLPASQYPVSVKMYSSTLVPFSDKTATAAAGSFNVVVNSTLQLPEGSQATSAWNYGARSWGQYYEYVIDHVSSDNTYTIYLNEIVLNYSREFATIGLYLEVEGFGNPIPLSLANQYKSEKYSASDFSFSNNSASSPKNGITVRLDDSSKSGDNITVGRRTTSIWGSTTYRGTITITPSSGRQITGISVDYRGSNYTYNDTQSATVTPGSYSISGSSGVWSGNPTTGAVTITMGYTVDEGWFSDTYNFPQIIGITVIYKETN